MRRGRGAAALVLVVAACGGGAEDARQPQDATAPVPSPAVDNPVITHDFPDPDVLEVDGVYYAYGTNGNNRNVRVARSTDLATWEELDDALPQLPSWVIPGKTWAPEVTEISPGRYVLYFTATNYRPTVQCIGTAVADDPEGPFEVVGEAMMVCPDEQGGAIDAATFRDGDGTRYLLWKNDGNCCGLDTWLHLAPLSGDGLSLTGPSTRLVKQDQEWEGHLVEAPTLVHRDGTYLLLYSANDYGGREYTVGYAAADAVTGPYTKHPQPLLATDTLAGEYVGPGGQDVVTGPDGQDYLLFHSWYGEGTYRAVNLEPIDWVDAPATEDPDDVRPLLTETQPTRSAP